MRKSSILVVFGDKFPKGDLSSYDEIISGEKLKELIEPGSVHEASVFAEELSRLTLPDGSRLAKLVSYKGYELWWMYYQNLFLYFCLPYTQYKRLLEYLGGFQGVYFYQPPYKNLFSCYLQAYGCEMTIAREPGLRVPAFIPFGVLLQVLVTFLSLPILILKKHHLLLFTGDKFGKTQDYDLRMEFIYQELRQRKLPFVEFIRSLESWKTVLQHAFIRRRPVIYSEAISFMGKFLSVLSGGRYRAKKKFDRHIFASEADPQTRFKFLIATRHLFSAYDDIWAVRIMRWVLRAVGIRAALFTAATERSFHSVLGCKLNRIPTVGIMHSASSKDYNMYDFMPGFDGTKTLSVDKYGLWSQWWREHYLKNSKAYHPEQLYVSGPMRPLEKDQESSIVNDRPESERVKVLFISEQLAVPHEVLPYLEKLLKSRNLDFAIKFRPYRDGFEKWLLENRPDLLKTKNIRILRGSMQEAIKEHDVVVGSHSTGVLEALLQSKMPVFFNTKKWGDYFSLKEHADNHPFFAESPDELIERIENMRVVSKNDLNKLREKYFGSPYKNGSKWIVDQVEEALLVKKYKEIT